MNQFLLLTDSSVNPSLKIGFGAYLFLAFTEWEEMEKGELRSKIKLQKFTKTSSSRLEVETVLWALEMLMQEYKLDILKNQIILYTDAQVIVGLPDRRAKLEKSNFISSSKKEPLRNSELYRRFYDYQDQLCFEIKKIKGHTPSKNRDQIQELFALVDQAPRKALKAFI